MSSPTLLIKVTALASHLLLMSISSLSEPFVVWAVWCLSHLLFELFVVWAVCCLSRLLHHGDFQDFSRKLPQQVDGKHLTGCGHAIGRSELSYRMETRDLSLDAFLSSDSHCKTQYCEAPSNRTPQAFMHISYGHSFRHVEFGCVISACGSHRLVRANSVQQRRNCGHFHFPSNLLLLLLCWFCFFFWLPSKPACAHYLWQ